VMPRWVVATLVLWIAVGVALTVLLRLTMH